MKNRKLRAIVLMGVSISTFAICQPLRAAENKCARQLLKSTFVPTQGSTQSSYSELAHAPKVTGPEGEYIVNASTARPPAYLIENFYYLKSLFGENLEGLKDKNILDVGSGRSEIARYLHETYGIKNARQLDWWYDGSPESLRDSWVQNFTLTDKKRFLTKNKKYLVPGLAQKTGLPAQSVDLITSGHVLKHFKRDQIIQSLVEFHRILRPSGMVIISPISRGIFGIKFQQLTKAIADCGYRVETVAAPREHRIEFPQRTLILIKTDTNSHCYIAAD